MIKKDRFGLFFFLLMLVCSTSKVVSASLRTLLSSIHSNTRLILYPLEHSSYPLSTRTLVLSFIHSNTRLILYPLEHSSNPLYTRTLVLSSIHSNKSPTIDLWCKLVYCGSLMKYDQSSRRKCYDKHSVTHFI